ncbi:MAG: alpha/beta hydrolase [Bacteroidota bacterium]
MSFNLKRLFRRMIFGVLVLVFLLLLGIELFDRYLSSEKGTLWLYQPTATPAFEIKYSSSGIRYLSIGAAEKPALVLVHGAPGSCMDWKDFSQYADLYERYRLLIVERPGYGGTRPRGAEKSIETQAKRLLEVLEPETQPVTLMGHSYGGPIVMVMAALQPEKIGRVIGVAGAYAADYEVTFKISYFIQFGIFQYLLPRLFWVANEEKLSHPQALRAIEAYYAKISVPVSIIHSTGDALVPYDNACFIIERLRISPQVVTLDGLAHPIQMNQPGLLVDFVMDREIGPITESPCK